MDNNTNPYQNGNGQRGNGPGGRGNGPGNGGQGPQGPGQNPKRTNMIILVIAAFVTILGMSFVMKTLNSVTNQEISYSEFQQMVEEGEVEKVVFDDDKIYIKPKSEEKTTIFRTAPEITYYTGKVQSNDALHEFLDQHKVEHDPLE